MTLISSKRVYNGKVINVDVDTVRFPNESTGELEMVRHPGASAVLPFLSDPTGEDPQILLVKQFRHAADGYIYEVPAGKLDGDEDPAVCAERELREETGCTAEVIEHLTTIHTTPGFTNERIHLFMASGLTQGEHEHEQDEFMSVETMHLSRALAMIRDGEISDSKSICAILYAAGYKAGN